jgi:FMN-dependent NADH-azoreductase
MTKTLLRIDTSARAEGSQSRALADHFESRWRSTHEGRVIHRDLGLAPPTHLDGATIAAFNAPNGKAPISDALVEELLSATEILIATPLYNFGAPSMLKAWFDHVIRFGRTFSRDERGYVGLVEGKRAMLLTVRGGFDSPDRIEDYQSPHLHAMLGFMGITDVQQVTLQGTVMPEIEARVGHAKAAIDRWFEAPEAKAN